MALSKVLERSSSSLLSKPVAAGMLSPPHSTASSTPISGDDDCFGFDDDAASTFSGSSSGSNFRKPDVLDKWKARVFSSECTRKSNPCGVGDDDDSVVIEETFSKKLEKQMAILKVSYPFLSEKQIRGKAWELCGLKSFMGGMPRTGLSPGVKKEVTKKFQKLNSRHNFAMPKKPSNTRKASPRQKVKSTSPSSFSYSPKNLHASYPQTSSEPTSSTSPIIEDVVTPLSTAHHFDSTQMSGIELITPTTKSKRFKRIDGTAVRINDAETIILPETPESSVDSYASARSVHYWTPPPVVTTILPSQVTSSVIVTQVTISDVSSSVNVNDSQTESGLDEEMNCEDSNIVESSLNDVQATGVKDNNGFQNTQELLDMLNNEIEGDNKLILHKPVHPDNDISSTCNNDTQMVIEMNENIDLNYHQILQSPKLNSDATLSGLNQSPSMRQDANLNFAEANIDSKNIHPGQTTPVKSMPMDGAKKKIFFEVTADIHQEEDIEMDHTILIGDLPDVTMEAETPVKTYHKVEKSSLEVHHGSSEVPTEVEINLSPYYHPAMNYMMEEADSLNVECSQIKLPEDLITPSNNQDYCSDLSKSIFSSIQNAQVTQQNINENIENISQSSNLDKFSLPFTPTYTKYPSLPACLLLSNFCSESDRGWTKRNLKPSPSINRYSDKLNQTLKEEFNKIIPPHLTLEEFFNAPDKTLEDVKAEVQAKVNSIIYMLEAEGN